MGIRSLLLSFCLGANLIFVNPAFAADKPQPRSCAYRVVRAIGIGIVAFSLAAPLVTTGVGEFTDTPHVGLGIYFDWENVQSQLTPELRKALSDPYRDNARFVEELSRHMQTGLNTKDDLLPLIHPRMASEYIGHVNASSISCKHKSLIMAAILEKAGIPSKVKWGKVDLNADDRMEGDPPESAIHVWLELPDYDWVADPTQGWVMNRSEYREKYLLQENVVDFEWTAKTVGLLIR